MIRPSDAPLKSENEILAQIRLNKNRFWNSYLAMYSSWFGGYIKDPSLMMIPVDDHQVHRGDAVFEAIKAVNGKIWLGTEHLNRLFQSAESIGLMPPFSQQDFLGIMKRLLEVAAVDSGLFRIFVSRGPGGFAANPYDSIGAQVYIILTDLKTPSLETYAKGVSAGRSKIPCKDPEFARIKSCNYLQNVLMKKEAVDRGLDFTLGFSRQNFFLEGSVENFLVLTAEGDLVHPPFEEILKGTTLVKALKLVEPFKDILGIRKIGPSLLSEEEIFLAREIMVVGTTLDVLAVTQYEGRPIQNGKPGSVATKLLALLKQDQQGESAKIVEGHHP